MTFEEEKGQITILAGIHTRKLDNKVNFELENDTP